MDADDLEDTKPTFNLYAESDNMDTSNAPTNELVIIALQEELSNLQTHIGNVADLQAQLAERERECAVLRQRIDDLGSLEERLAASDMAKTLERMARHMDGSIEREPVAERDGLQMQVEILQGALGDFETVKAQNKTLRRQRDIFLDSVAAMLEESAQLNSRSDTPITSDKSREERDWDFTSPEPRQSGIQVPTTSTTTNSNGNPLNTRSTRSSRVIRGNLRVSSLQPPASFEQLQSSTSMRTSRSPPQDLAGQPPMKKHKTVGMFGGVPSYGFTFDPFGNSVGIQDIKVRISHNIVDASNLPLQVQAAISRILEHSNGTHGIRTPRRTPAGTFVCLNARSKGDASGFKFDVPPTGPCPQCSKYKMPGHVCVLSVRHENEVIEFGVMPRSVVAAASLPNEPSTWMSERLG